MIHGTIRLLNPQPLIDDVRHGSLKRLVTGIVFDE